MPGKEELKAQVCAAIDKQRDEIIRIGETILKNPETGFREIKTAQLVASKMEELGLRPQTGLALTGVKGKAEGSKPGPTLALLGELDSLRVSDHPHADPDTGAAHACGHNAQVAGMLGAAMGLLSSGAMEHLAGSLVFFAVPAEELIEVQYRMQLKAENKIEFLTGKAELIRLGHFDDVQLAMMIHTKNEHGGASQVVDSSNGHVIKRIRFIGRAAHAGSSPQTGINALNAATLAITGIHFQRETFYDADTIRIHPIITKGGDGVNVVPAEVTMETFVRGRTREGITDAHKKVDRALRGAAMTIGAQVEIQTVPGPLPQLNNGHMAAPYGENVKALFGEGQFALGGHRSGSTDMGDLGHIIPCLHPYGRGASGEGHTKEHALANQEEVYVAPAKLLAMTAIDMLYDQAQAGKQVLAETTPPMTKDAYLAFKRGLFNKELYSAEEV